MRATNTDVDAGGAVSRDPEWEVARHIILWARGNGDPAIAVGAAKNPPLAAARGGSRVSASSARDHPGSLATTGGAD